MMRILHLEDDPVDAGMVLDLLREEGVDCQSQRVDTLEEFRRQLESGTFEIILSDFTLPGVDAFETLKLARQARPEVPFIFVSGTLGEDVAIDALKMGATDYVLKQGTGRLAPAVRRALREAEALVRRKQAEEALRKSNARFDAIISSAMDAIISVDARQQIVLFNPAAEKMFGVPHDEALGRTLEGFIPPRFRSEHARHVAQYGETRVSARKMGALGAVCGLRANGEEFPIEASISQIEVEGEKLFTVILRDITERMKAQTALAEARDKLEQTVAERTAQLVEANGNLRTFAHTAAHDLRSPLRAIRSFSSLVLDDAASKLGPEEQAMLERVVESADLMGRLLDDMLEYSKLSQTELKLEPVNLDNAVREALALAEGDARGKGAVIHVGESLPEVIGNKSMVVLLVNNLVSNALKFVPAGVQPRIDVSAERAGERVRIWVRDNGIGIAPEYQERIFGVFVRLHGKLAYPGTGLGLAIVRKGAERMGGLAGVESEVGKGSRFWVELRASTGQQ